MRVSDVFKRVGFSVLRYGLIIATALFFRTLVVSAKIYDAADCPVGGCTAWCTSAALVTGWLSVVLPAQVEDLVRFELLHSLASVIFLGFAAVSVWDNNFAGTPLVPADEDTAFMYSYCGAATTFSLLFGFTGALHWMRIWFFAVTPERAPKLRACLRYVAYSYIGRAVGPHPGAGASPPPRASKLSESGGRGGAGAPPGGRGGAGAPVDY